ncbi:hypothetical protein QBC36DRAFT_327329 [Triangularia setosa]|uniref:Uncharacterized protein n=1 Tax=Triangularia setosa TaxID=2587417 RepID=A0AAN6W8G8_9PEZI|nr:hypothetical protein QBC36DRAFT_327329 [Podospora setosa]
MGSIPTLSDISAVHIIFQRHAESVSEIPPNLDYPPLDSLQDLENIVERKVETVQTGVFLPDGLTETGAQTCLDFVRHVPSKLDNVYLLASSPLTRAIESIQGLGPSFQLVGPYHSPRGGPELNSRRPRALETSIYVHPGLMEPLNSPAHIPGTATFRDDDPSRRYVTFLRAKGGKEEDGLVILNEQEVDITRMVWPDDVDHMWQSDKDRIRVVTDIPNLASIETSAREARIWLRDWAAKVLAVHQAHGRPGIPRIVVCTHGGMLNFLTQEWHTDHQQRPSDGRWEFRSPTVLKHLEATVWTFESGTDADAVLKELPRTDSGYYTRTLGQYYRHLGDDRSRTYLDPDGSDVDQKAAHFQSIEDVSTEVCDFGGRWWTTLKILTTWTGLENSQTEEDDLEWDYTRYYDALSGQ